MEAVFRQEVFEFFPVTFRPVSAKNSSENRYHSPGYGRNLRGKNPKIAARNTASIFQLFSGVFLQEPVRTT